MPTKVKEIALKIFDVVKKVATWWKTITLIVGLGVGILKGVKTYNNYIIAKAHKEQAEQVKDSARKETEDARWNTIFQFIRDQKTVNETQSDKLDDVLRVQNNLQDYMIKKVATKDEVLEVQSIFKDEKKK